MTDYISREAAIEAICAGCNAEYGEMPCEPSDCYIRNAILNLPAADVVELVRYKDNPFPQIELRYPSGYVFTITIPYEAVNHTTACLLDDIAVRVDWRKEHD